MNQSIPCISLSSTICMSLASTTLDRVNSWLLQHNLRLRTHPCVSPDFCLDWGTLGPHLETQGPSGLCVYKASTFGIGIGVFHLAEDEATGDHVWLWTPKPGIETSHYLERSVRLPSGDMAAPASWKNLLAMKNLVQLHDSGSTIFPTATGTLATCGMGIGARFTTLHWPAVDWTMGALRLSMTANQNSVPRELVYDVDAMLDNTLGTIEFPFLGCSVPEGHQGQSIQGMSHGAILTKLKYGFHRTRVPWGFNADHQPIGGRFDAREDQLVSGCILATYITFDLSPELSSTCHSSIDSVPPHIISRVKRHVGIEASEQDLLAELAFLYPAVCKMKSRDVKYAAAREDLFKTEIGRRYFRELSIDELPGITTPLRLATALCLCEVMGMHIHFVAPGFGFQKNFPYPNQEELRERVQAAWNVCQSFGASLGFHSGSGKSAENYALCGNVTEGHLEIKTSGRYTYEMGVALSKSSEEKDQHLWKEWYAFTQALALQGAHSEHETERRMARSFITHALQKEGRDTDIFANPVETKQALDTLNPNPDHMFWFEYNFLFVLAGEGKALKTALGDHSPAGYRHRERFYTISQEARLLFAQNVASYILFLAETTGLAPPALCDTARSRLYSFTTYAELLEDIGNHCLQGFGVHETSMKQVTLAHPEKLVYHEKSMLPLCPGPQEAFVRVHCVGVCGTDYHAFQGVQPFFAYPRVLGHELSVEVIGVGSHVTNVKPGDRCCVEPFLNCCRCTACLMGKGNCCENISVMGVHSDGGFREYTTLPARKLHSSQSLSWEQLALIEPLCIGAHAVRRAAVTREDSVLIIGVGPIGMAVAQLARAEGAHVVLLDMNEKRLALCRNKLDFTDLIHSTTCVPLEEVKKRLDGKLPTVVFDATGNPTSMDGSFHFVSHGGRLIFVGLHSQNVTFNDPLFHKRELTLLASRNATSADFAYVINLVESNVIDIRPWITHRSTFSALPEDFPTWLASTGVVKGMVVAHPKN